MDYKAFCERCKHYSFNLKDGILCGLTNQKPSFKDDCEKFELDEKRAKELDQKTDYVYANERHDLGNSFLKGFSSILFPISKILGLFSFVLFVLFIITLFPHSKIR